MRGHVNRSLPCSLTLFVHVPKTGGTTVMEYLSRLPHRSRRVLYLGKELGSFGGIFRFYAALSGEDTGGLFADALPALSPPPVGAAKHHPACHANGSMLARALFAGLCGAEHRPLNWRRTHIVAEIHDPVGSVRLRDELRPRLRALRALYAAADCPLLLTTVLREPAAQALSMFRYQLVRRYPSLAARHSRSHTQKQLTRYLSGPPDVQLASLAGCGHAGICG